MGGQSRDMWHMLIPQDAPTWEKLGIAGISAALLTMLALVLRVLIRGPGAALTHNKATFERLFEQFELNREQQERHHTENIAANKAHNEKMYLMLKQIDDRLNRFSKVQDRLAVLVAQEKAPDKAGMVSILHAINRHDEDDTPR